MANDFTPNTLSRLAKIGIEDPWELILNLPYHYDDFTAPFKNIGAIKKLKHGKSFYATLILKGVKHSSEINKEKKERGEEVKSDGRDYVRVELSDGVSSTSSLIFGRFDHWLLLKKTHVNKIIPVFGKVKVKGDFINLDALEIVPESDRNRIVARYRGKEKVISPAKVADLTKIALMENIRQCREEVLDAFNEEEAGIIKNCRLAFKSLEELLAMLHIPKSAQDLDRALNGARRLNAYYGIRKALAATERQPCPESAIPRNLDLLKELVAAHPFAKTITNDQKRAIWDIIKDLELETPMDRLLSADVGNGKTLAYGIPAAYACRHNKNVVILLPTEPLAGQVADNIRSWYPDLKIHLVTAGFKDQVEQGSILIGTTAVLTWLKNNPEWKVDFAITDEQQKMGTAQRESLNNLGTHVLEATATPIPRTMAQTLFGSKKVSLIKDCPVVKNITTKLVGNSNPERKALMDNLDGWLTKGFKIAVIYPLVTEQQAHFYHVRAETKKEAEKFAQLLRKASVTVNSVMAIEEANAILNELDDSAEDGFIVEIHADEQSFNRLQKRFSRYTGASADHFRYLGSIIDDEMAQKNRTTIMNAAAKWEKKYPGRVAVIHGRSKRTEKAEIIKLMNSGRYDILISTTLIEIGVDVKDLKALAAINAEKLGAFTLHQLRGRVARNGGDGDFFMNVGSPLDELEPETRDRLDLLVKYKNGDDIALYDMEQRGFGNLGSGGKDQKGFEDGLFPSLKLSAQELDHFLRELSRDINQARQSAGVAAPA
jgi:ATP-dependent DNA helicase RecG